jgi:hypothetical protein
MIDRCLVKSCLCLALLLAAASPRDLSAGGRRTVSDTLWIWGHPAGVYNDSYLRSIGRMPTILNSPTRWQDFIDFGLFSLPMIGAALCLSHKAHDANYLTFHWFRKFRDSR